MTTTNGGVTWRPLPAPPPHVTQISFASANTGYAWSTGGGLWLTSDGGRSWRPAGLDWMVSLATAAGWAWALAGLEPAHVWRAVVGSAAWTDLGLIPDRTAELVVHADAAYVLGEQGAGAIPPSLAVYRSTRPVLREPLPCLRRRGYPPWVLLGASADGSLFLVCVSPTGTPAPPEPPKPVQAYLSTDEGRTWTATLVPPTAPTGVTAAGGRLFAWGTDLLFRTTGPWQVGLRAGGSPPGFVLVDFQDDEHGVALTADGQLWATDDGGSHWRQVRL